MYVRIDHDRFAIKKKTKNSSKKKNDENGYFFRDNITFIHRTLYNIRARALARYRI